MKRTLVKIIVFILGFIFITLYLNKIFSYKYDDLRVDNVHNYYNFSALYEIPDNSLDVAYVGTSTFYCGISPLDIWNDVGITGEVFSTPRATINTVYYYIQEILKTQSPKVVVLDAATLITEDLSNESRIKAFTGMKHSLLKLKGIMNTGSKDRIFLQKLEIYSEIFALHDRWSSLKSLDFNDYKKQKAYLKGYGYTEHSQSVPSLKDTFRIRTDKNSPGYINDIYDFEDIPSANVIHFENIINICKKNNIEILLIKIPNFNWTATHHNKINALAETYDIPFIDFNVILDEIDFDEKLSFWDYDPYMQNGHLNYTGAKVISEYLGSYLFQSYSFVDRVNNIQCEWKIDYMKFLDSQKEQLLHTSTSFPEYIEMLKHLDKQKYLICISAKDEAFTSITQENINALRELGILLDNEVKPYACYLAVLTNEKIIYENIADTNALNVRIEFLDNIIELESASFFQGNNCSIKINNTEYAVNRRGLNFVIWDLETHQLVDSVAFDTYDMQSASRMILYFD